MRARCPLCGSAFSLRRVVSQLQRAALDNTFLLAQKTRGRGTMSRAERVPALDLRGDPILKEICQHLALLIVRWDELGLVTTLDAAMARFQLQNERFQRKAEALIAQFRLRSIGPVAPLNLLDRGGHEENRSVTELLTLPTKMTDAGSEENRSAGELLGGSDGKPH